MGLGTSETWGRGGRFGIVPIGGDRVYWFATGNRAAGIHSNPEARRDELLRRFGGWHAPIRSLIERTPLAQILEDDIHDIRPFRGWSRGRVTLLGDAAHPTTPNMGQGACMAIESGVAIARALAEIPAIGDALVADEDGRHARTAWITKQSWQVCVLGLLSNPLACATRALMMTVTPSFAITS